MTPSHGGPGNVLLRRCRRRCTPVAKPGRGSELPVRWQVGHVLRSVGELLLRVERGGRLLKRCRRWRCVVLAGP
jgi:hypothetical protein